MYIYGLGLRKANFICACAGLSFPFYFNKITPYHFSIIHFLLKNLVLSDKRLERVVSFNILRKVNIKSIKGIRHSLSLPVHGQRTRTNASTQRTKRARRNVFIMNQKLKKR